MLLDLIPSKFIIGSMGAHAALVGVMLFEGVFSPTTVSLVEESQGSVEVLFNAQTEEVKKELKKQIKKIIRQKTELADFGDKLKEEKEEVVKQVSLEDLKSLKNISPELKAFLRSLKEKIQDRQVYPYAAKRLRQTGQVVIKFDVLSSGEVQNASIQKKSEHKRLDSSALSLIAGISKLDHFPTKVVKSDKISITVPIEYKL